MNEIREKNDLLNHLSITDPLTNLYNRRGFFEAAQELITSISSRDCPAVIGYVDMEFDRVDDQFRTSSRIEELISVETEEVIE